MVPSRMVEVVAISSNSLLTFVQVGPSNKRQPRKTPSLKDCRRECSHHPRGTFHRWFPWKELVSFAGCIGPARQNIVEIEALHTLQSIRRICRSVATCSAHKILPIVFSSVRRKYGSCPGRPGFKYLQKYVKFAGIYLQKHPPMLSPDRLWHCPKREVRSLSLQNFARI